MPEISEVARIVYFLRKYVAGRTIASIQAFKDEIVYKDTSAEEFEKELTGKKITGAGQQGKYFWLETSGNKQPLMHFGMTGWIMLSHIDTQYYKEKKKEHEWPPKFAKFIASIEGDSGKPFEMAFVDGRRLGRIRLIDGKPSEIRALPPLNANGPDPYVDKDKFTLEWFTALAKRKKVPIKAMLLDQANISGIGNWVGDEILFHAKVHPEQYSNLLNEDQVKRIYDATVMVCTVSIEAMTKSDEKESFPDDWLMRHRWGKGKEKKYLPNGELISYVTVGGRTSAFVPSVQKKTGAVAGDVSGADEEEESPQPKKKATPKSKKRTAAQVEEDEEDEVEDEKPVKKASPKRQRASKASNVDEDAVEKPLANGKKVKTEKSDTPKSTKKAKTPAKASPKEKKPTTPTPGRRTSARFKQ